MIGLRRRDLDLELSRLTSSCHLRRLPPTPPATITPELAGDTIHQRDSSRFNALLRLAPGVTEDKAAVGLDTVTPRLDGETFTLRAK